MHVRLTQISGPPGNVKEVTQRINEMVIPRARQLKGVKQAFFASDDATGKTVGFVMFETEEDLVASREAVQSIREETVAAMGGTVLSVEELEVVAQI